MKLRKIGVQGSETLEGEQLRRVSILLGAQEVCIDLRIGDSAQQVAITLRKLADEIYRALARETDRCELETGRG